MLCVSEHDYFRPVVCTNINTALAFGDIICFCSVLLYGSESLYGDTVVVIIFILPV